MPGNCKWPAAMRDHLDGGKLGVLVEEALDEQLLQGYEVGLLQQGSP